MSGEGDEWPGSFADDAHEGEVLPAGYSTMAPVVEDALDADGSESGGAHELVAGGGVDVDGERVEVFERDRLFGIEFEG